MTGGNILFPPLSCSTLIFKKIKNKKKIKGGCLSGRNADGIWQIYNYCVHVRIQVKKNKVHWAVKLLTRIGACSSAVVLEMTKLLKLSL